MNERETKAILFFIMQTNRNNVSPKYLSESQFIDVSLDVDILRAKTLTPEYHQVLIRSVYGLELLSNSIEWLWWWTIATIKRFLQT